MEGGGRGRGEEISGIYCINGGRRCCTGLSRWGCVWVEVVFKDGDVSCGNCWRLYSGMVRVKGLGLVVKCCGEDVFIECSSSCEVIASGESVAVWWERDAIADAVAHWGGAEDEG